MMSWKTRDFLCYDPFVHLQLPIEVDKKIVINLGETSSFNSLSNITLMLQLNTDNQQIDDY